MHVDSKQKVWWGNTVFDPLFLVCKTIPYILRRAILLNRQFSNFDHKNRPQGGKWSKYFI